LVELAAEVCCIIGHARAGTEVKTPRATVVKKTFFMV
jgi:hypothetical protein